MTDQRQIELEIKFSHQEKAIEELQQALYEQHLEIEKLEKSIKLLNQRFENSLDGQKNIGPANQKPPHY